MLHPVGSYRFFTRTGRKGTSLQWVGDWLGHLGKLAALVLHGGQGDATPPPRPKTKSRFRRRSTAMH